MGDVEIFRAELTGASSVVRTAVGELVTQAADLEAEDVGVENPLSRVALRLELNRRLSALQAAARDRAATASRVAADAQGIADRFQDLDDEQLVGRRRPT